MCSSDLIYIQFADQLQVLTVNGVLPTEERVAQMEYDISTVNYMYFKRGHMRDRNGRGVVRGIREFMAILTSDEVMGMGGILNRQHGLVSVGRGAVVAERRKAQAVDKMVNPPLRGPAAEDPPAQRRFLAIMAEQAGRDDAGRRQAGKHRMPDTDCLQSLMHAIERVDPAPNRRARCDVIDAHDDQGQIGRAHV